MSTKNPFSIVVQAILKALETQRKPDSRFFWKKMLYKSMYEDKKYSQEKIRQLFRFVDWVLDWVLYSTSRLNKGHL